MFNIPSAKIYAKIMFSMLIPLLFLIVMIRGRHGANQAESFIWRQDKSQNTMMAALSLLL